MALSLLDRLLREAGQIELPKEARRSGTQALERALRPLSSGGSSDLTSYDLEVAVRNAITKKAAQDGRLERMLEQGYEPPIPISPTREPIWKAAPDPAQGELFKREPAESFFGPQTYGFHASPSGWAERNNPEINLDLGEGFGFHAGTMKAADERVPFGAGTHLVNLVARPGRAIDSHDLGMWSNSDTWGSYLDTIKGLDRKEVDKLYETVKRLKKNDTNGPKAGRVLRQTLLDMGVDRVRYRNIVEDAGSTSMAFLDPSKLRWASEAAFDPKKLGQSGLLYGLGGGGLLTRIFMERDGGDFDIR